MEAPPSFALSICRNSTHTVMCRRHWQNSGSRHSSSSLQSGQSATAAKFLTLAWKLRPQGWTVCLMCTADYKVKVKVPTSRCTLAEHFPFPLVKITVDYTVICSQLPCHSRLICLSGTKFTSKVDTNLSYDRMMPFPCRCASLPLHECQVGRGSSRLWLLHRSTGLLLSNL